MLALFCVPAILLVIALTGGLTVLATPARMVAPGLLALAPGLPIGIATGGGVTLSCIEPCSHACHAASPVEEPVERQPLLLPREYRRAAVVCGGCAGLCSLLHGRVAAIARVLVMRFSPSCQ